MPSKWTTVAPGIRARDHETRKHGVKPDRYFTLRFSVNGRQVEEGLGWATEGWTLAKAQAQLVKLKEAQRTGDGDTSLRAKREASARADAAKREEEARRAQLEKTVADLWDRYWKEVVAVENKPRTAAEKSRLWERRIKLPLGSLKIKDVTEDDAGSAVRAPLKVDAAGQIIGGKAEAGNVYRLLHHLFSKALAWGLRPRELGNPLENVTEPKVKRRERLLAASEIAALQRALDEATGEQPQIVAVIRAAILTGARISELLTLRWIDVRDDEGELHLHDTKTGFSRRPVSSEALRVLVSVERMPGVPWVFRSVEDPTKHLSYDTVQKAFGRIAAVAGVDRCTLHTIRHWFATMTANSVNNPRVGMALTGHRSHAAYIGYVHGDKEQARELAEQLAALANGQSAGRNKVVSITRKRSGE